METLNTVTETVENSQNWIETAKEFGNYGLIGLGVGAVAAVGLGIFNVIRDAVTG